MTGNRDHPTLLPEEFNGWIPPGCPDTIHKKHPYDGNRTLLALRSAKQALDEHPARAHEEFGTDMRARDGSHHLLLTLYEKAWDCTYCGPYKREELTNQIVKVLSGCGLFIGFDPMENSRDATRKYVAYHEGRAASVPVSNGRFVLSSLRLPERDSHPTIEWNPDNLPDAAAWAASLRWPDKRRTSYFPKSLVADRESLEDQEGLKEEPLYEEGKFYSHPQRLSGLLHELEITFYENGRFIRVPIRDRFEKAYFEFAMYLHSIGESEPFEPDKTDTLERGTG